MVRFSSKVMNGIYIVLYPSKGGPSFGLQSKERQVKVHERGTQPDTIRAFHVFLSTNGWMSLHVVVVKRNVFRRHRMMSLWCRHPPPDPTWPCLTLWKYKDILFC